MAELSQWLRTEARRQAARPDLLAALLSGGSFAYARHRLGFMALRMLLRTGVHAIEIQLFVAAFVPWDDLAPLIAYRALCSLFGAAHWGALEAVRDNVREAVRRRRPESARAAIERWMGLTLSASGALILIVFGRELARMLTTGVVELRAAYALACVLRLGSDACLRTLHSGVFAIRRVHRPLWSTLAPDVLELAILAFGFGQLGLWSVPLGTLAGGACDGALAYAFVRRAYLQRRLPLPRVWRSFGAAWRAKRESEFGFAARHALANVTLQLDGVLLLMLAQSGRAAAGTASFAALYYVLRPLVAASTHWVRTFYFDLKLIESGALRTFRPQLLRFLERLAVGWAALLALITLGLARHLFGEHAGWGLLVLVPFFVARSAFALLQVVAFGAGDLQRLFRSGVVVLGGLFALRAVGLRGTDLLASVTLLLVFIVLAARRWGTSRPKAAPQTGLLDYCAWLAWMRESAELKLAVLHVDARSARVGAIVRALRLAYPSAAIVRWARRYVLLAAAGPELTSARALILACGGSLQGVWLSTSGVPLSLFELAQRAGALPDGWTGATSRARDAAADLPALETEFRARFPSGEICDLQTGGGLSARPVSAAILRALVAAIQARSRGREARSERALPFLIAVYAPCGQARALFIADKNARDFDTFRGRVHDASVRASWPALFEHRDDHAIEPEVPRALAR